MQEKRQYERIPLEALPDRLKAFTLDFGQGETIQAKTYDASTIGVGINVEESGDIFHIGDCFTLCLSDPQIRLIGEVHFIIKDSDRSCRLGVEIKPRRSIDIFESLLNNL